MVSPPSYSIFRSKPLPSFAEQIRTEIREHGSPELIRALRHEPIHKDEYFEIIAEIDIDGRRRQVDGMANCPMCQPNKFLSGRLCWFPALECCAIIGHCCANKEHSAEAERRYKDAALLKWQEDYFLAALPFVPEKLRALRSTQSKAAEAERIHRKLRKDASHLMKLLREQIGADGQLTVHFEIEQQARQGERGVGRNRVFDTMSYGSLEGFVALRASYDPVGELDQMIASMQVWNVGESESAVIDAIASMNQRQRDRGYAVLTNTDHKQFPAFARKIEDFEAFFARGNLDRLHAWGGDPRNPHPVSAEQHYLSGVGRQVQISGAGSLARIVIGETLHTPMPTWIKIAKRG